VFSTEVAKDENRLYQTTWRHIPECSDIHSHCPENSKSHMNSFWVQLFISGPQSLKYEHASFSYAAYKYRNEKAFCSCSHSTEETASSDLIHVYQHYRNNWKVYVPPTLALQLCVFCPRVFIHSALLLRKQHYIPKEQLSFGLAVMKTQCHPWNEGRHYLNDFSKRFLCQKGNNATIHSICEPRRPMPLISPFVWTHGTLWQQTDFLRITGFLDFVRHPVF
jgi:hypothetical protein